MNHQKPRIAFLYFEEIHHIPHFIGIAVELAKNPNYTVEILTYKSSHVYLFDTMNRLHAKNLKVIQLSPPFIRRIIDKMTGRKKPSSVFLFKAYKKQLLSYDAVVFTEKNHKYLYKQRGKSTQPYFIFTGHGPAGRDYSYIPELKLFDLHLMHGTFYKNNLEKLGFLAKNHAIIGYSKFDVIKINREKHNFFPDEKPVVVYNPHFNKLTSSWYKHGLEVLEYFYQSDEFNLIFAPHIYLFNRKGFLKPKDIPQKYFQANNIYIDLGSVKSSDMTYTLAADIYLGDVSSQVYEFGIKPRPCVFINSQSVDWQSDLNYHFWHTGPVIEDISQLHQALHLEAFKMQKYLAVQKELFDQNFLTDPDETAMQKGANAIDNFLKNELDS
jgi:hypothetical protein